MTETKIYEIALSKYPIDEFCIGAGDSSRLYDQNARDRAVFIKGFKEALNITGVSIRKIVKCEDPMVCLRGCSVHEQTCKHPIYER